MKKTSIVTIFVLVISISSLLLVNIASGAQGKKILLKVPSFISTSVPVLGDSIAWIAENLKIASDGQIVMKLYQPGKLVHPFEILDAVSTGKVNAGYGAALFYQGKIPSAPLFSTVPFGFEAPGLISWHFHGNGLKLYQEMYDQAGYNVKVLPASIVTAESSGWFSKPIESIEDLKGLRMRISGLGAAVSKKLGISASVLPPGEIFAALEKGVLDATEFSCPHLDENMGFHKIVKYNYFPAWHQQATLMEFMINKDTWNGMSPQQQKLIEMVTMASLTNSIAECESLQGRVIRENVEKRGVIVKYWSDEMLAQFKKAWDEVVEEKCAQDPFFKKVWEDQKAFRAEYDTWKALGFLPRPKHEE